MNAGIFQLCYLDTQLIHQPDELAGVSIADSAIEPDSVREPFTKRESNRVNIRRRCGGDVSGMALAAGVGRKNGG